ncbi:MAG: hypothetical protein Q8M53_17135 [Burkholderiales bacterium]|nr:hypothetical protein [Burkholderiales bacterium]
MSNQTSMTNESDHIRMRYVAFCDVLGFANAVENRFEETIAVYKEFMEKIRDWPMPEKAEVSIYSDSILIVADELTPVLHAVNLLWFATLGQNWMIRGGIAYGRYWERRENGNLFVVSDALVRAVKLEGMAKMPAVTFSPEVDLHLGLWMARFEHGLFTAPILHFQGLSFVNPFNNFWFTSARTRATELLNQFPEHKVKYSWFLDLAEAVERDEALIPDAVFQRAIELGILVKQV